MLGLSFVHHYWGITDRMKEELLFYNLFQGLKLLLIISLIPLVPALVTGFFCSFLQAVTQIQDQALSFLPKFLAVIIALYLFSEFIWESTLTYFNSCFLN